jgi:hypothetical protein
MIARPRKTLREGMHVNEFIRSERGSSFLQALFILPIFIMIVVGGYEIWKVHSVKESLRSGTYQATRYLSINANTSDWYGAARNDFIVPELLNNGLVGSEVASQVRVIAFPPPLACGETFTVRAEVPWQAVIPFVALDELVIAAQYEGQVVCAPGGEP